MKNIYTLYDKKAKTFDTRLIVSTNDYTIQRDMFNIISDPACEKLQFVISPSDYAIYKIGDYEEETGQIHPDVLQIAEMANITASIPQGE